MPAPSLSPKDGESVDRVITTFTDFEAPTAATIKTLREALADKEKQALTDFLTGLLNRHGLAERVDSWLDSQDGNAMVTATAIDINGFKELNNTYGHDVGDRVLAIISHAITQSNSDGMNVRLGGDEIAVVRKADGYKTGGEYTDDLKHEVRKLLDKLVDKFDAEGEVFDVDGVKISKSSIDAIRDVTFSAGTYVATVANLKKYGVWKILRVSDKRMYADKGIDDIDPDRTIIR